MDKEMFEHWVDLIESLAEKAVDRELDQTSWSGLDNHIDDLKTKILNGHEKHCEK